jgi:hypothetical protein
MHVPGSCIVCGCGTDTGLGVNGVFECVAALLELLGMPDKEAEATALHFAEREIGCEPGMAPSGVHTWFVRLCAECAARSEHVPRVGLILEGELLPTWYIEPPEGDD